MPLCLTGSALARPVCWQPMPPAGRKFWLQSTINPRYLQVLHTYTHGKEINVVVIPERDGAFDADEMIKQIDKDTAAAVIQFPNFYGLLEPEIEKIETAIHTVKGLLIMAVDPISLGILKPPADWGADIAVGEGQPLGNPLSFGGPYLGFFAANKKLMRRVPGRLVGQAGIWMVKSFCAHSPGQEQHIRGKRLLQTFAPMRLCALLLQLFTFPLWARGSAGCSNQVL